MSHATATGLRHDTEQPDLAGMPTMRAAAEFLAEGSTVTTRTCSPYLRRRMPGRLGDRILMLITSVETVSFANLVVHHRLDFTDIAGREGAEMRGRNATVRPDQRSVLLHMTQHVPQGRMDQVRRRGSAPRPTSRRIDRQPQLLPSRIRPLVTTLVQNQGRRCLRLSFDSNRPPTDQQT